MVFFPGLRRAGNNLHEAEQCLVNEIRNRSEKFGRGVHVSASVLDEECLASKQKLLLKKLPNVGEVFFFLAVDFEKHVEGEGESKTNSW